MKVATDRVSLLEGKALFGPLHKLKLAHGNRSNTVCDMFTAAGQLVVKTNTGDFKAPADGELWPPVQITMQQIKKMALMYAKSAGPVQFERSGKTLRVDTTVFTL